MAKALGSTPEDEYQPSTHLLSKYLVGNVGLLFTNREPAAITEYFSNFSQTDFARAGTPASRSFTVPAGIVYSMGGELAAVDDVPMAHSLEPELRKLNMPTSLTKGKITMQNEYTVCEEGDVLDSRQTRLLKLFGVATADFTIQLVAYWGAATNEVTEVESTEE
jgi:mRNA turnover protein 4